MILRLKFRTLIQKLGPQYGDLPTAKEYDGSKNWYLVSIKDELGHIVRTAIWTEKGLTREGFKKQRRKK